SRGRWDARARERVGLAGYDGGGRAAWVVAAFCPERTRALVSANGYNIHDIAGSTKPASAKQEHRLWYQYYFHTRRGRAGLEANRRDIGRLLWQWSPNWRFDEMQQKTPEKRDFFVFCYHFATQFFSDRISGRMWSCTGRWGRRLSLG